MRNRISRRAQDHITLTSSVLIGRPEFCEPAEAKIGRQLKLVITPTLSQALLPAELDVNLPPKKLANLPSSPRTKARRPTSRVATPTLHQSPCRILKVISGSAFSAMLRAARSSSPSCPTVRNPLFAASSDSPFRSQIYTAHRYRQRHHCSTAADLGYGIDFSAEPRVFSFAVFRLMSRYRSIAQVADLRRHRAMSPMISMACLCALSQSHRCSCFSSHRTRLYRNRCVRKEPGHC